MTDPARIARLVDFESTGFPDNPEAAVCEAARLDVDLTAPDFPIIPGSAWSSVVNPGRPIPPETSAVHHLTDRDVAGAPDFASAQVELARGLGADDILVAHHCDFEQHFCKPENRWIDTWKCALRAWPDAPGHSNQVLRYHLDLPVSPEQAMPPHRALPDCFVTAEVLRKLLSMRPAERLVEITGEPGFLPKFIFGKHYGKTFKEVAAEDPGYLTWIIEKSDLDADVKFTARHWLARREKAAA